MHYALFSGFLVAVTLLLYARERRAERGHRVRVAILATALGALVFLPFAVAYRRATEIYGMQRYFGGMGVLLRPLEELAAAGDPNRLYGPLTECGGERAEGDFFPGLAAVALAGIGLYTLAGRRVGSGRAPPERASRGRRRWALALDIAIAVLAGLDRVASGGGVDAGPLRLRDSGRVQVFLTVAVLARLATAPPKWAKPISGWLWRRDRRACSSRRSGYSAWSSPWARTLLLPVSLPVLRRRLPRHPCAGPGDRALPPRARHARHAGPRGAPAEQDSGSTPGRGRRDRRPDGDGVRALPAADVPHRGGRSAPVYESFPAADFPGAAVEWPLGIIYDFDYVFDRPHEKPLVNGVSGFFPKPYADLATLLQERPIPASVCEQSRLGASVLIYHSHDGRGLNVIEYAYAIRRGLAAENCELTGVFPTPADAISSFACGMEKSPRDRP